MHARSEDSFRPVRPATLADQEACESHGSGAQDPSQSHNEITCFATHGSFGVVDLGATKTVIGSELVSDLIKNLSPEVQRSLTRCSCAITFRFGNHGVLQSKHALVIPIHGFLLKVAIVPGSTPFLLSNTLLRALGAIIDTDKEELFAKKINRKIPLQLTARGLFLLDINELAESCHRGPFVETHVVSDAKQSLSAKSECLKEETPKDRYKGCDKVKDSKSREALHSPSNVFMQTAGCREPKENSADSNLFPKSITKGFVVPATSDHGQPCSSTSTSSSRCGTTAAGHVPVQPAANGCLSNRFWQGPFGANIPASMAGRSILDQLVCQPLPTIAQDRSQDVSSLRGPSRLAHNIETPNPRVNSKGRGKSSPKTKAKAKSRANTPIANDTLGDQGWDMEPEDFMLIRSEEFADQPEIQHLETRMLHMENALSQVIAHLEKISVNMETAAASETK